MFGVLSEGRVDILGLNPRRAREAPGFVNETDVCRILIRRAVSFPFSRKTASRPEARFRLEAILNSFVLVLFGEMGDKTQLLALLLAAKFRRPWTLLAGILLATLTNHALAAWGGWWLASAVPSEVLRYGLAALFFIFGLWVLIPDKESAPKDSAALGVFMTAFVAFFMAEMGDKTQLATIALGARYANPLAVTLGTTAGMMAANVPAVFLGDRLLRRIPMTWVRRIASALFILSALMVLWG